MTALQRLPGEARLEAGIAPNGQHLTRRMSAPESMRLRDALPHVSDLNRRGEL